MARPRPDTTITKRCYSCKQTKPRGEFYGSKSTFDGLQGRCKECSKKQVREYLRQNPEKNAQRSREWRAANPDLARDHLLKTNYGVPVGTYARLLEEQDGKCAICRTSDTGRHERFHVDHCHDHGHVRGLLCHNCNVGIGNLKHDKDILLSAIMYLDKTKEPPG